MEETNVQNFYSGDCPDDRRGGGVADLGRDSQPATANFKPPALSAGPR